MWPTKKKHYKKLWETKKEFKKIVGKKIFLKICGKQKKTLNANSDGCNRH
jgi:hypothetical protein